MVPKHGQHVLEREGGREGERGRKKAIRIKGFSLSTVEELLHLKLELLDTLGWQNEAGPARAAVAAQPERETIQVKKSERSQGRQWWIEIKET